MAAWASRAGLAALLLTPAMPALAEDFDTRGACWDGDLAMCELGLLEHAGDVRWLATASWAYSTSDQQERAREVSALLTRALNKLGYSFGAVQRFAREDFAAGNYRQAAMAYGVLLDFEEETALIIEINQTSGNPRGVDEATQEAIDGAVAALRREAYEGRGLAQIMVGDADAGLADLQMALEFGRLRETRRMIENLGIDYVPPERFGISEIDADLERVLREIADAQDAD